MSEAHKAGEQFCSPELMALTGWFPPFSPGSNEALWVDRRPSPEANPIDPIS